MIKCPKCGNMCDDHVKYCVFCGTPIQQQTQSQAIHGQKEKTKHRHGIWIGLAIAAAMLVMIAIIVIGIMILRRAESVSEDSEWEDVEWEDKDAGIMKDAMDESESEPAAESADVEVATETSDEDILEIVETAEADVADDVDESTIHSYQLVKADVDWFDAQRESMAQGGHLVTFDSEEELRYVMDMLDREEEHYCYYVGGTREANSYEYRWINRLGEAYGDSVNPEDCDWIRPYWLKNEPTFKDENDTEECYMDLFFVNNQWVLNDIPSDLTMYYKGKVGYIIEWDE